MRWESTEIQAFCYDADGNRILTIYGNGAAQVKVYTPFPDYEVEVPLTGSSTVRTTYRLAGQIVAVQTRTGTAEGEYYYTYADHLGNVAALSSKTGGFTNGSLVRYDPYGGYRTTPRRACLY